MLELENQGLVCVNSVFDEMINEWLKGFEIDQNLSNMTLDEMSMETDGDVPMEETHAETIPYFMPDVTRMAFFLKHRCTRETADRISSLEVGV